MLQKRQYATLVACLSYLIAWAQPTHPEIELINGVVPPHERYTPAAFAVLASSIADYQGQYHVILQFEEIPDHQVKENLLRLGVALYTYIPNYAYLATVPKGAEFALLPVSAIVPVLPAYKIAPALGKPPFSGGGQEILAVAPFPGVDLAGFKTALEAAGWSVTGDDAGVLRVSIARRDIEKLARHPAIMFVEPWVAPEPEGIPGRTLHRASISSHIAPLTTYDGSGIGVGIGDDGNVKHIDFQGRVTHFTQADGNNHGDMTAGITGSAGNRDPRGIGMAPGADIYMFNISTYPHITNAVDNFLQYGIIVTNTSYGEACGGAYSASAQALDLQVLARPELLHCFSAGNSAIEVCNNPYSGMISAQGTRYGNITGGRKAAKHTLVAGNIYYNDSLRLSSSRGPTYDGRIKPDLCGHGQENYTTASGDIYQWGGGTSAASPILAGGAAVLYQAFAENNNGLIAPSGLIKALMLNTAEDIGRPGPDYDHGWGRLHLGRAIESIEEHWYLNASVSNGAEQFHSIVVPPGTGRLRVMVYWPDPASSPLSAKALINDLDLSILPPSGPEQLPLVLSRHAHIDSITKPAYLGRDRANNMEQVVIDQPASGLYTIKINGYLAPQGPQSYYLVYYFEKNEIAVTYPAGGEHFVPGETETIRWDAVGNSGTFALSYSLDNMATWQTISNNVPGNRRHYNWIVPNTVTGNAFIRVSRNNLTGQSSSGFTILGVPAFQVQSAGLQQARISWSPVTGANRYTVYSLGEKYMEPIGETSDTSLVFPVNAWEVRWLSVDAGLQSGTRGLRAIAQKYEHQPCEASVTLHLQFDNHPGETYWKIFNGLGNAVASGGPYGNNPPASTLVETVCLPLGCYQLAVFDSYGDGMCCTRGNGSYQLRDPNGQLLGSGGSFTASSTVSFCLQSASQPVAIQQIQSGGTSCSGTNDGWAGVTATGGSGAYTYIWNTGATTATISNLAPGTYTVTVSDGNSQAMATTQVSAAQPFQVNIAKTAPSCYGDSNGLIATTVSGGTPPYAYIWSNGHTSPLIGGLTTGSYFLTITDSEGCQTTQSVTLSQPPQIVLQTNVTHATSGNNGAIDLIVTGGIAPFSYIWSNGVTQPDPVNLASGVYAVTVTDANGCQAQATAVINSQQSDFCIARGSSTFFEWIDRIQIGNFSHQSGNNGGYGAFQNQTITLSPGISYFTLLKPGYLSSAFSETWRIWIDFNHDNDFLDAGEQVFASIPTAGQITGMIVIPPTMPLGPTKMRIAMRYGSAAQPCGVFPYGEVEDYSVNLVNFGGGLAEGSDVNAENEQLQAIFPNPSSGMVQLDMYSGTAQTMVISVINNVGQRVYTQSTEVQIGINSLSLDLQALPVGPYWVMVQGTSGICTEKLLLTAE
jgi:hypothetical protein